MDSDASSVTSRFDDATLNGNSLLFAEDSLGSTRVITDTSGVVCYDADFYPYGGERPYTNTCTTHYKFEGKERDTETGNDYFGARYYSNRFGRWLSSDWSAVPVAVPYANLTNPQTLNLYGMVADDPESFADLDGHQGSQPSQAQTSACNVSGNSSNSCTQQQSQTTQPQHPLDSILNGVSVSEGQAYRYEQKTVDNPDGSTATTITTTTVTFSTEPGHEGEYRGSTQTQRTNTIDSNGEYHPGTTATTTLTQDQGRSAVGNKAFSEAQTQAATPNRTTYFGSAVKTDINNHPGKYVAAGGAISSLVLGPAGYPAAAAVARVVGLGGALYEAVTHWKPTP